MGDGLVSRRHDISFLIRCDTGGGAAILHLSAMLVFAGIDRRYGIGAVHDSGIGETLLILPLIVGWVVIYTSVVPVSHTLQQLNNLLFISATV
jgi:hypothetical protein